MIPLFFNDRNFDDAHAHAKRAKSHTAESRYQLGRAIEM